MTRGLVFHSDKTMAAAVFVFVVVAVVVRDDDPPVFATSFGTLVRTNSTDSSFDECHHDLLGFALIAWTVSVSPEVRPLA